MSDETRMVKPSTQAVQRDPMRDFLEARVRRLGTFVTGGGNAEAMIRVALFEASQKPKLRMCSPESIYASLIISAVLGLAPGSALGHAYLVPYKGQCTLQPGYKGLLMLARRAANVRNVYAHSVYKNDLFRPLQGSTPKIIHEPAIEDRGPLRCVYAIAKLRDSIDEIEILNLDDIEKIRRCSAATDGPWNDWYDEMSEKSVLKRLCKRLPLGDEYFRAARVSDIVESGKMSELREVMDVPEVNEALTDADAPQLSAPAQTLGDKVAEQVRAQRGSRGAKRTIDVESGPPSAEEQAEIERLERERSDG